MAATGSPKSVLRLGAVTRLASAMAGEEDNKRGNVIGGQAGKGMSNWLAHLLLLLADEMRI